MWTEKAAESEINDAFKEVHRQEMQAKFFYSLNITLTCSSTQLEVLSYREKVAETGKIYLAKAYT